MCTAEEVTADFNSVADHPAFAMFANGCDSLDSTFEAVEGMPRARGNQLETLVIVISTNFASCHKELLHICAAVRTDHQLLIQNEFVSVRHAWTRCSFVERRCLRAEEDVLT
jgi:hypothetical protein